MPLLFFIVAIRRPALRRLSLSRVGSLLSPVVVPGTILPTQQTVSAHLSRTRKMNSATLSTLDSTPASLATPGKCECLVEPHFEGGQNRRQQAKNNDPRAANFERKKESNSKFF